jgi:kinesin family protein 6/9
VFQFPDGNGLLSDDQDEIFQATALPAIDAAFQGYNSCIFAYGQTGSGKTFTITGGSSYNQRGVIPRVLTEIFSRVGEVQEEADSISYKVFVSFLEIYNENAYDILDKNKQKKSLENWSKILIQDDEFGEAKMQNLRVFECESEDQALSLLFMGNSNRITSTTKMNSASSRSHAVFTISVEKTSNNHVCTGKIHIVDLAGSERHSKAHLDLVDSFVLSNGFGDSSLVGDSFSDRRYERSEEGL